MKLFEITSRYNDTLNPAIWDDDVLKPEVAEKLKEIADEFIEYLEVPELDVTDLIITGSNANYNWTDLSDIDLHIVANLEDVRDACPDLTDDFFAAKKALWNDNHEISIYGQPVECYVQDEKEPHHSSGIYSLTHGEWSKKPTFSKPSVDDSAVEKKTKQLKYEIDHAIDDKVDDKTVDALKDKISDYRKAGLKAGGEWSTGNLTFKELRNTGYLEKLWDYARAQYDDDLSLTHGEEQESITLDPMQANDMSDVTM